MPHQWLTEKDVFPGRLLRKESKTYSYTVQTYVSEMELFLVISCLPYKRGRHAKGTSKVKSFDVYMMNMTDGTFETYTISLNHGRNPFKRIA